MATKMQHNDTAKELSKQKQLFCKLLLLEIEKYEQSLGQIQKSNEPQQQKEEYGDDWKGFSSLEEAEEFGRAYYHELLNAVNSNNTMSPNDAFPNKYYDQNITNIGNGQINQGIIEWVKGHNYFVKICKQCYLADFSITSWIGHSFAASYTISIVFSNDNKVVNHGNVNVVMSKQEKKITHLIETSEQQSYQQIIKNAPK